MKTWKFEKTAGLILDHQDDPGFAWDEMSQFWPDDLEPISFGVEQDDCLVKLEDESFNKVARYPVNTPENALASSMYFLAHGIDYIEKEAHIPIAKALQNHRVIHGVELPDEFKDYLKTASAPQEEVYVDPHLPVTTPEQCEKSIDVFEKNAEKWPAAERMKVARKLKIAAENHGLEMDSPLASEELSKSASFHLDRRINVMKDLKDHPGHVKYMTTLAKIKARLPEMSDYRKLLKTAAELEEADLEAGMDAGWESGYYLDPVRTLVEDTETEPLPVEKEASFDWNSVDYGGLRDTLDDGIVDQIESDPETIIPTLPLPYKNMVEDYVK